VPRVEVVSVVKASSPSRCASTMRNEAIWTSGNADPGGRSWRNWHSACALLLISESVGGPCVDPTVTSLPTWLDIMSIRGR